jgi:magnesium-transporting ATPase (P-type)
LLQGCLHGRLGQSFCIARLSAPAQSVAAAAAACHCLWVRLQLNNVLIFILLAAAAVVAGLQEWIEFGLILGVITINVLIGMVQEGKAEKAAEAIKAMLSASGVLLSTL